MKKCWRICGLRKKRLEKRTPDGFDTNDIFPPLTSTLKDLRSASKYGQKTQREDKPETINEKKRSSTVEDEEQYLSEVPSMYTPQSFYIFSYQSLLRRIAFKMVEGPNFNSLVDIVALVGTFKLLAYSFIGRTVTGEDLYDYIWGYLLVLDVSLRTIAFGLIADKNAFLFRDQFNIIYLILIFMFFSKGLYFLQVLHIFRIFPLLNRAKLLQSASEVLRIIRASLATLCVFVAFYLLLLLVFSLYSWILFSDSMGRFCLPTNSLSLDAATLNFPNDLCSDGSNCTPDRSCHFLQAYMNERGVTTDLT